MDRSHPRFESLRRREKLAEGFRNGLVVPEGLIAQGRGEAFDYLLGERTIDAAEYAERAAAAALFLAKRATISVNGNVAALAASEVVALSRTSEASVEVNLFHWSESRARAIREALEAEGAKEVLAENPDRRLEGVAHDRGRCHSRGIFGADVVLIPLEDGDRASALVEMGKTVISIDLNPLSRTSRAAIISIVDELTRAIPNITKFVEELSGDSESARRTMDSYDNSETLSRVFSAILERLKSLSQR
ncbi:MAG TPA: phosphopantothenate/pantothenate synthetase [Euryarchaeota archaeon]|nr:phosphopantothenate/pantothenate synthetase [Euryarchaeota archaeon]